MIRPGLLARTIAAAALAAIAAGCGEEVVVRTTTRVERDGGISRRCEIIGSEADGATPTAADWLTDTARVRLAYRERWTRVDESPGRISVLGFFREAREIPPLLAHRTERGVVTDRAEARLSIEDLIVLDAYGWRESTGDPFGPAEVDAALDEILATIRQALEAELRRTFGSDLDVAPVGRFLTKKVRPLVLDLLPSIRRWKSAAPERPGERERGWRAVLAKHQVPVADPGADLFARTNLEGLSAWMRRGVAAALSSRARPIDAAQLSFWPEGDDADQEAEDVAQRVFGDSSEVGERLTAAASSLAGFYGDAMTARFRFEARLVLPGRLLRTNGAPDREGVVWLHRDEDLASDERVHEAETVELRDDALRSLGARRELDTIRLVQLTDLLRQRDPQGELRKLLADAVRDSRLGLLRDETHVAEPLRAAARELADLLDPAVEPAALP